MFSGIEKMGMHGAAPVSLFCRGAMLETNAPAGQDPLGQMESGSSHLGAQLVAQPVDDLVAHLARIRIGERAIGSLESECVGE